jgi:hypothetical protein
MIANLACRLCEKPTCEVDALCVGCKASKGPRVAALLERSLADASYASACLASLAPEARARFARLLSAELLSSPARLTPPRPGLRSTRAPALAARRHSAG